MLEEHPAEMAYTLNRLTATHPSKPSLPVPPVATPSDSTNLTSKHLHNQVWSMDNPPYPASILSPVAFNYMFTYAI